ncbi:MAG TPA: DUF4430 domain-containing protein [Solirubrobacteraceae bacterium]|nr:DUF4430 domain-containing protein [Solirubrobacteraceae bacterium]
MTPRRSPARAVALAALCALEGCGLGPGPTPKDVQLTITRDFGARVLHGARAPRVVGQETVMSLLRRNVAVNARYAGGFVQGIDGLQGGTRGGKPWDWFYYVNGVQAPKGAAETSVHAGDRVWWDLHDWSQTETVPAVVGSFPEPFLAGIDGKRLPVRVECAEPSASSCRAVVERLRSLGAPAALAAISGGDEPYTLRVLVGRFSTLEADPSVHSIGAGPRSSGVYARFSAGGAALDLIDEAGHTTRTLGAGAGLVAATRYREEAPVWVVAGTDSAGVSRAASALDAASLDNHFALALEGSGTAVALPDRR